MEHFLLPWEREMVKFSASSQAQWNMLLMASPKDEAGFSSHPGPYLFRKTNSNLAKVQWAQLTASAKDINCWCYSSSNYLLNTRCAQNCTRPRNMLGPQSAMRQKPNTTLGARNVRVFLTPLESPSSPCTYTAGLASPCPPGSPSEEVHPLGGRVSASFQGPVTTNTQLSSAAPACRLFHPAHRPQHTAVSL